jgi:hypothetical protein
MALIILALVGCGAKTNPPVTAEPQWDSASTRELAKRACFDCHSNETVWPWYASLPIVGAVVSDHVQDGRAMMNFSEWDQPQEGAHEAVEVILEGEMPPGYYTLLHGSANLSEAETRALVEGLRATIGAGGEQEEHEDEEDDD